MQSFTDWRNIPTDARGASVAMGNFDGVHRGHRSVIDLARKVGEGFGHLPTQPLGIITFEPHPRAFFAAAAGKEQSPFRLMNAQARAHRFEMLGVERLFELQFDAAMAAMSAEDFARDVLAGGLGVAHVTVGADFRFGAGRKGGAEDLMRMGKEFGFEVTIADLLHDGPVEVSSTAIRAALTEGRVQDAASMLGHSYRIEGPVLHGEKRGRDLGYPTANMSVAGLHLPRLGVYAVKVDVLDGPHAGTYNGAASLGVRPMFGENAPNLESYLFDFAGDLYGAQLSVALIEFLRPELKFSNLDALIDQMAADCDRARGILGRSALHG
ncbi:bifunctional riboflavin kinase/FAD synthetase [Albirhodobacter sp. R86504]|uniref:bifunctional riboflavin kinase/FAD synthetase n=1 Tax=Albirhodobacter sp. R86504 TaxID=3093848 RepID=UPI0036732466